MLTFVQNVSHHVHITCCVTCWVEGMVVTGDCAAKRVTKVQVCVLAFVNVKLLHMLDGEHSISTFTVAT